MRLAYRPILHPPEIAAPLLCRNQGLWQLHRVSKAFGEHRRGACTSCPARRRKALRPLVPAYGVTMKGSDLGKGYSPAGLAKRGVSYEQNRDFAAVSRSLERETSRAFG